MTTLKERLGQYEIKNVQGLSDKEKKIEGAGSYGTVYKVTVNGVPRIAKQLHHALIDSDVSPEQKKSIQQRFYQECLLLSGLDHPNIVEFIGVYFDPKCQDVNLSLIMEQLHTDLGKFINQETHPRIPISIKVSILRDVSFGLVYLHSKRPEAIIHRDLASQNILLTKDLRAKITDLGVSKLLNIKPNQAAVHTKCPGTLAYMPPEALKQNPVYGTELDIFSFGQVSLCVGVQSIAEPFDYCNEDADMIADFASRKELHILKRKVWINQLQGPNACLREVIYSCLQDDPAKRPTAIQVSSIMKILCARYPKSPADLAAVWDGPTAEKADFRSQTEPEKIKHLQEQLRAAKTFQKPQESSLVLHTTRRVERRDSFIDQTLYQNIPCSGFAVTGDTPIERLYTASLYYLGKDVRSWEIHLVVTLDDEPLVTRVTQHYKEKGAIEGPYFAIEFEGERIELDIPMEGIPIGEWRIRPSTYPKLAQKTVDQFMPGMRIPYCHLTAKFLQQGVTPDLIPELYHLISLKGAKEPNNVITIEIDPTRTLREQAQIRAVPELTLCHLTRELNQLTDPIHFGVYLKIEQHILDKVKSDNRSNLDGQKQDLFRHIANNSMVYHITWKEIATALDATNDGNLALRIREKYCHGDTTGAHV